MAHNRRAILSTPNVRFGSKADIAVSPRDVRFTPDSGHVRRVAMSALCQKRTSASCCLCSARSCTYPAKRRCSTRLSWLTGFCAARSATSAREDLPLVHETLLQ